MITRRSFAGGILACGAAGLVPAARGPAAARARPTQIVGPVTGGRHGHIFGGFIGDIGQYGYVEEEYFVSGTVRSYTPLGIVGEDGCWAVKPAARAPFKTRVIVHRPVDPAMFNGVVICEWANVTAGFELSIAAVEGYHRQGFAYAAISAQTVGLEGFPGDALALRPWDPDRYGMLTIPGDSFSFDVFSAVAEALGPGRPRGGTDPMGGLNVRRLIATGASQSAARLTSYANAIQPLDNVFAGFIPVVGSAYGTFFDDFVYDPSVSEDENRVRRLKRIYPTRIRDDLTVPVIYVTSQSETLHLFPRRQPDTERFRLWEVAGAAHLSSYGAYNAPDLSIRDGIPSIGKSPMIDILPVVESACHQMVRWIEESVAPKPQRPIRMRDDGAAVENDAFGNATGGVRLPELEVPTATYDATHPPQVGTRTPLAADRLNAMYPTLDDYVAKVRRAAADAVDAGVILPHRADQYVKAAAIGFDARA